MLRPHSALVIQMARSAAILLVLLSPFCSAAQAAPTVLEPDLSAPDAAGQWIFYGASGKIEEGQLVLDGRQALSYAVFEPFAWADGKIEAEFRVKPQELGVLACGFMARVGDGSHYYYVHYDRGQAILVRADEKKSWNEIKRVSGLNKPAGKWHRATLECRGPELRVFLNGKLLYTARHSALKRGRIGFYASQGLVRIRNVRLSGIRFAARSGFVKPRPLFGPQMEECGLELIEAKRIWDQAPHNAFTDLVRYKNQWVCVFREGLGHVSPDGALRVLLSRDGTHWKSAARVTSEIADLRDAKISVTPGGRLMLSGAGALHQPNPIRHQSYSWFSDDGAHWSEAIPVGDPNLWLWRVTWHKGTAYGFAYGTAGDRFIRLYRSSDGKSFERLVDRFPIKGYPNETSMAFGEDDTAYCLLRQDGAGPEGHGLLGQAKPPYTDWAWKDLGIKIGGPMMIRLPDGRFVAAVRLYDRKVRTSVCWLDVEKGALEEAYALPSGGDTSYAGLVWQEGVLWMSYYSSHEGKTCIYQARFRLSP